MQICSLSSTELEGKNTAMKWNVIINSIKANIQLTKQKNSKKRKTAEKFNLVAPAYWPFLDHWSEHLKSGFNAHIFEQARSTIEGEWPNNIKESTNVFVAEMKMWNWQLLKTLNGKLSVSLSIHCFLKIVTELKIYLQNNAG